MTLPQFGQPIARLQIDLDALTGVVIAAPVGGDILVYDGVDTWRNRPVTGDITISALGVVAIAPGVIVNADISPTAEIDVSKLADGAARQLLETAADGVTVQWASNIDIPGTLDVTGLGTFDAGITIVAGNLDLNSVGTILNIGAAGNDFGAAQLDLVAGFTILGANGLTIGTTLGTIELDATGGIDIMVGGAQTYRLLDRGDNLTLQSQSAGSAHRTELYAADGDGSDNVLLNIFGVGVPSDIANREFMSMGFDAAASAFIVESLSGGTGTPRNIIIRDDGTAWMTFVAGGEVQLNRRLEEDQGADVGSANDLTLGGDGNTFEITGAVQINRIVNTDWQNGSIITLLFTSNPVVADGQASAGVNITILLAGTVNFNTAAGDTLTLRLSEIGGTQAWREVTRSVR